MLFTRAYFTENFSQIWIDDTAEAPGVQGLGGTYNTFLVWANGDGYSPDNMCRHPYSGAYFKVFITDSIFPEKFVYYNIRKLFRF